ncbi:sensor histidine kinase [Metallumcola ferriviriculae]|uniref:Oxygen sensor histidine kinase NreB n=1 Tax=Metallumcola ferriviriculae TaxID=3039180 RepID=A0AAU0UTN9_9FIRM|nr:sensor histidine kinase [Desulfitibacteraceae bacterium MK1]
MFDINSLDRIIKETVKSVEKGKEQIYDIAENARVERDNLQKELERVQINTAKTIHEVDQLEKAEKTARYRLMEVSRNFSRYTEQDIKEAYDNAREYQVKLGLFRERESQLRQRRTEVELRLRKLLDTENKAEKLITNVGGALRLLTGNLQGITEKLEELQQRQNLGLQVIKAQEEERRRVARDIHDGPAQSMASVILRAEICERLLEKNPAQVPGELQALKEGVKSTLQDVRKIIFDLRPMVLDDLGLIPTLKRYFAEFQERTGLLVDLVTMGKDKRVSSAMEVAIFRVIQEAINNSYKHAQTETVNVRLEMKPEFVNCKITDEGVGFNVEEKLGPEAKGYGLIGMRERVELLEGTFKISSLPGKGTEIKLQIPIKE